MGIVVVVITVWIVVSLQAFVYRRFWMSNIDFTISFSAKTAFEGNELYLTETLVNRKILPLPYVAIKFQLSRELIFKDATNSKITDDYYRNDLFSILMYQKITRRYPFICGKRGYYTIKSMDVVGSNILMTDKMVASFISDAAITVYPKLISTDEFEIPYKKIYGAALTKRYIITDPFEFKGIREYQPYDSFKSVNFKATAKTGQLMVNVNDYTVAQEVCVILNLQSYSAWSSDSLYEQSIRLAASLCAEYIGDGVPVSFISNGRDLMTGQSISIQSGSGANHLTYIYEALARVDLGMDREAIKYTLMDKITANEFSPIYILLSTYSEKDLLECFEELTAGGAETLWIVPAYRDTPVNTALSDRIIKWEVVPEQKGGSSV